MSVAARTGATRLAVDTRVETIAGAAPPLSETAAASRGRTSALSRYVPPTLPSPEAEALLELGVFDSLRRAGIRLVRRAQGRASAVGAGI
jgi:hypothetical protein